MVRQSDTTTLTAKVTLVYTCCLCGVAVLHNMRMLLWQHSLRPVNMPWGDLAADQQIDTSRQVGFAYKAAMPRPLLKTHSNLDV